MIRHLFTLIWNRKRANLLLITEIFFAFVVLFVVGSTLVYNRQNYQAPLGFDYEQVWEVDLDNGSLPQTETQSTNTVRQIVQRLATLPGVQRVAVTGSNTPFSGNNNSSDLRREPRSKGINGNVYWIGEEMPEVLRLSLKAGRWLDKRDEGSSRIAAVISEEAQAALFPNGSALGQILYGGDRELQVVGVTGTYRADGDLSEPKPAYFTRVSPQDTTYQHQQRLLVRVQPDAGAELEKRMSAEIMAIGKGWSSSITPLAEQRATQLKKALAPLVALALVCVFLIINVALGLFGVLWFNISQRRAEIGLRRAIGAGRITISAQILGEILVVTTFGLLLGLLVAAQFPLLGVLGVGTKVYLPAMVLASGLIYVLAAGCALYPSRLAAGIHPAVALREE
ncbi:MAG TPA: FtsX-like permease family protein [Hymenobacter sp.]|jgi:putative ABC transport system permease protein